MHKTRFRYKYLKNKIDENKRRYTKQRKYCLSLLKKIKERILQQSCSFMAIARLQSLSITLNTVNMILLSLALTLLGHPITFLIYLIFQTKYILHLICSEFFSVLNQTKNLIFFTRTESFYRVAHFHECGNVSTQ